MTSEAIASDLRTVPDSDLQKLSQNPGAVPGYLVAAEIQRRSYERSQPQGTPPGGPKPTLLSILGQNLPVDPQKPLVQTQPPAPGVMPPPTEHFDEGGDVPYDNDLIGGDTPPDTEDYNPPSNLPVMSEKPAISLAGAASVGLPTTSPQSPHTSPTLSPQSPTAPPTRGGLLGFLQKIAPALQYAGNVGAGMAAPGSSGLASGVGYANQVQQQEKLQNQAMVWKAMEAARENARLKLEQQKEAASLIAGGATAVGPDGKEHAPDVMSPPSPSINGVPMGATPAPIPNSGTIVPQNPTQIGNQNFDMSTYWTPQKAEEARLKAQEENKEQYFPVQTDQGIFLLDRKTGKLAPATNDAGQPIGIPPKATKEADEPLGEKVGQLNDILTKRWQVLHPNTPLPASFALPPTATHGDYSLIDKGLESVEHATGTKIQQDQTNAARALAAAVAAGNRETKNDTQLKQAAVKTYAPALDSAERFNVMAQNRDDATNNNDQQAMLSLLANHLGMTMGLQKGARMNQALINEAVQSRPWLQGLGAKYDSNGYLSGVTLSKPQMDQMVNLARDRYAQDISKSRSDAKYIGVTDDGPSRIPSDATKRYYGTLAGGDKEKAKRLAAADGWTVQ